MHFNKRDNSSTAIIKIKDLHTYINKIFLNLIKYFAKFNLSIIDVFL